MPDNPILPEPSPTRTERVNGLLGRATARASELVRILLTGTRNGRVRRPLLFIAIAASLTLGLVSAGLVALTILALTDAVVEL